MQNNKVGAPAVPDFSMLYSQNVKKTLLQVPKDRGTWGVEGLSMPRRCTIAEKEIAVTNSVMAANTGSGTARNILFACTGQVVPTASLRYQQRKAHAASKFGIAIKGTPAEVFLQDLLSDDVVSYTWLSLMTWLTVTCSKRRVRGDPGST
jgi:hypothetical protein